MRSRLQSLSIVVGLMIFMLAQPALAQSPDFLGNLQVATDNGNDNKEGRLPLLTSNQANAYLKEAFTYLRRSPTASAILDEIIKSNDVFLLVNTVEENDTDIFPNSISISWDPLLAMRTHNGGRQSPALALIHEMTHALHYITNPKEFAADSSTPYPGYTDGEEYRTITKYENAIALELGEDIRWDHKGKDYLVSGPTAR